MRGGASSVEHADKVDLEVVLAVLTVVVGVTGSRSSCDVLGSVTLEKPTSEGILNNLIDRMWRRVAQVSVL